MVVPAQVEWCWAWWPGSWAGPWPTGIPKAASSVLPTGWRCSCPISCNSCVQGKILCQHLSPQKMTMQTQVNEIDGYRRLGGAQARPNNQYEVLARV